MSGMNPANDNQPELKMIKDVRRRKSNFSWKMEHRSAQLATPARPGMAEVRELRPLRVLMIKLEDEL
jgi:hypothetical protein